MKQFYKNVNFTPRTIEHIAVIGGIIDEYVAQGYRLTVRQLYYQLVARGIIENTMQSYKRTTGVVNDARMAGLLDWDAIEDRTREFIRRSRWGSGGEILGAVARQFHMDHWTGQDARVFIVVEKEALAGVLERVAHEYDAPLLAARGYPSGTVLREFALSDVIACNDDGQRAVILHLGDHDPSGIDMSRDLTERIQLFAGCDVSFHRIALNMDQIDDQKPPPNPAKTTDSRFESYMELYGEESWELDALSPSYLTELVTRHVREQIDFDLWDERAAEIKAVRDRLMDTAARFDDEAA